PGGDQVGGADSQPQALPQHADTLDEREAPLTRPSLGSLAVHAGIVLVRAAFPGGTRHNTNQWGTPNPLGGAIGVSAVDKIPLPNRSITPNLVANDTTSSVPTKPDKVEKKKAEPEDPDAVALDRNKRKKPSQESAKMQKY